MRARVYEHFDDVLVLIGIVILLCSIYLGLGGAAALAFLGIVILVTGVWVAMTKDVKRRDP